MSQNDIIIALTEEIGHPDLFVGRKKELEYFLDWALNTKEQLSQSIAILARRKKGKTALVQRLFNLLYTRNDPQIIPFYYKIEEGNTTWLSFSTQFYLALLTQYFGYKLRDVNMIHKNLPFDRLRAFAEGDPNLEEDIRIMEQYIDANNPDLAWKHARNAGHRISSYKNLRIIQIIDEFQFLNEFVYTDRTFQTKIELASFYQGTAESKVSPQIITGSYIGWLSAIIGKMTARYRSYYLENLTDEDALAAVYNYANFYKLEVEEETATYIPGLLNNDPFYISALIRSFYEGKNLTSRQTVLDTLKFETSYPAGEIAKVWLEYLWAAFDRVNDKNAKKIVLYLAKYGDEERSRKQIKQDLNLDMSDDELEKKLHKLVRADIIAYGATNYDYKGLGDRIFEMVFRKVYEKEIEEVSIHQIENQILKKLASTEKKVSFHKGVAAEYRVINLFMWAGLMRKPLEEIVYNPPKGLEFGGFRSVKKRVLHFDQVKKIEADIWCESEEVNGVNYMIEVKDWRTGVSNEEIRKFISKKKVVENFLGENIGYIFYSEQHLKDDQIKLLEENGIMYTDRDKLRH